VFGIMVTMPSVEMVQVLVDAGLDYLLIDMEHSSIGIETLHAMIGATRGSETIATVRIPSNVPWLAKPVLDAGALGICFPMIKNARDAQLAWKSVRYPPEGDRGWGPFYAQYHFGESLREYVKQANANIIAECLIEHSDAIRNIHEIAHSGIDLAFIAPNDLSLSMGHTPSHQSLPEAVTKAIHHAESIIKESPAYLGGLAATPAHIPAMLERGYRYITIGFDWRIMEMACSEMLKNLRRR